MSFSLQLQPQTVTVKYMTREEHMAVRQTPFDRHLINFVFMQFHHSDYNDYNLLCNIFVLVNGYK